MASEQEETHFATVGSAFLGKVAQRLQNIKAEELSPADLARWTDVAVKLQQAGSHSRYDRTERLRAMQRDHEDDEERNEE